VSTTRKAVPHDLDGPVPHAPLPLDWKRVHCFKTGTFWTWEHYCPNGRPVLMTGFPHGSWASAFHYAEDHARRCL
jgi:hypothetical protein